MRKPVKWTLIGLGIFVFVVMVVVSTFFISSAVVSVAIEGLSNTMAEQVKKEIPNALTETEIREIIREEKTETLSVEELKQVREFLKEMEALKQVEQAKEEVATEEVSKTGSEETTGTKEGLQELITGQEFIYNGVKIALTKYELVPTNIDKNLLWAYLYVENIDTVPHEPLNGMEFIIYYKGREVVGLCSGFTAEEGKKGYDTGSYRELYPGEVCEGWISNYIDPDFKAEDIEIHFEPLFGGTRCIWVLK